VNPAADASYGTRSGRVPTEFWTLTNRPDFAESLVRELAGRNLTGEK
jgi:hypothetical protein